MALVDGDVTTHTSKSHAVHEVQEVDGVLTRHRVQFDDYHVREELRVVSRASSEEGEFLETQVVVYVAVDKQSAGPLLPELLHFL